MNLTYSLFKNAYMSVYRVMGNVILAFSIMAVLISLFIVQTSITRAVYDDYRLTGVYKSLGFTPGNIIAVYVIQYLFLSLISIPAGLAVAWFITRMFMNSIAEKLGALQWESGIQQNAFFLSFVVIVLLVLVTALLSSFKAAKIRPA